MTDLRQAATLALDALKESVDLVHQDYTEHHRRWANLPTRAGQLEIYKQSADSHEAAITALQAALAQPEQEPTQWRDMVVVSLVREGINKHKARELADHFATKPAAQWDKPSASFNEWWDGDYDDPANPFTEDSAAYWAWAGWQAGQRKWHAPLPEQEPVISAWSLREVYFDDDGEPVMHRSPSAVQRPWVKLTPEEILDLFDRNNVYGSKWIEFARTVEAKLKERNT